MERNRVHIGDVRELAGRLAPASVQTIITSPPYWNLRSYLDAAHDDKAKELGREPTIGEYVAGMVAVFRALWPALKDDGTCWINLGDSYIAGQGGRQTAEGKMPTEVKFTENSPRDRPGLNHMTSWSTRDVTAKVMPTRESGLKPKDLAGIPWRVALALQDDGWYLRSDIIWAKPAPMPESVTDRPTRSHEYLFLLSKRPNYYYDATAIAEKASWTEGRWSDKHVYVEQAIGGSPHTGLAKYEDNGTRNRRTVWTVNAAQFPDSHYATFPPALIRPCVLAGTSERGECAACGTAWGRVVESLETRQRNTFEGENGQQIHRPGASHTLVPISKQTTGWAPRCSCPPGTPTRPQVVLDPFMGSGTTAQVAHELGRDWQGFDLDERALKWTADRLARFPVGMLPGLAG